MLEVCQGYCVVRSLLPYLWKSRTNYCFTVHSGQIEWVSVSQKVMVSWLLLQSIRCLASKSISADASPASCASNPLLCSCCHLLAKSMLAYDVFITVCYAPVVSTACYTQCAVIMVDASPICHLSPSQQKCSSRWFWSVSTESTTCTWEWYIVICYSKPLCNVALSLVSFVIQWLCRLYM